MLGIFTQQDCIIVTSVEACDAFVLGSDGTSSMLGANWVHCATSNAPAKQVANPSNSKKILVVLVPPLSCCHGQLQVTSRGGGGPAGKRYLQ